MTDQHSEQGDTAATVSRRRVASTAGGVAVVGGLAAISAGGILATRTTRQQPVTVTVDPDTVQQLVDLSGTLCGGGAFDSGQATMLLELLAADPDLSRGFVDLLLASPVAGTDPAHSAQAEAAMQAILRFWYIGEFAGAPVANRSTAYYQLTSWQAMYTPPYTVCKAYGAWAEAPDDQPALPSI